MNTIDLSFSMNDAFEKNAKKAKKEYTSIRDIGTEIHETMEDQLDVAEDLTEQFSDIDEQLEKNNKLTQAWHKSLDLMKGVALKLLGGLTAAISLFSFRELLKVRQDLSDINYQMGLGHEGFQKMSEEAYNVALATGKAANEVSILFGELVKMRVSSDDVALLAESTIKFSEATGMGIEQATAMTANLSRMGKMGAKSIVDLQAGMMKMQRAVGLADSEMDQLGASITSTSRQLYTMGASQKQIANFSKNTVKLAGAFAQVGIEAEKATGLVERLLDPDRIEDNALLYAKLGLSIEDAMNGNLNIEDMGSQLASLGAELDGMGTIAANELAKSMGMGLTDLRSMIDLQEAKTDGVMDEVDGMDALTKAQEEQMLAGKSFEKSMNNVRSIIGKVLNLAAPLLDTLGKQLQGKMKSIAGILENLDFSKVMDFAKGIGEKFMELPKKLGGMKKLLPMIMIAAGVAIAVFANRMKKKFFSVSTEFGASLNQATEDAIAMGSKKGAIKFQENMKQVKTVIREALDDGLAKGIKETTEEGVANAKKAYLEALGSGDLYKPVKALTAYAAKAAESNKKFASQGSFLNNLSKQNNDQIEKTLNLRQQDYLMQKEAANHKEASLLEEFNKLDALYKKRDADGNASEKELKRIAKARENVNRQIENAGDAAIKAQSKADANESAMISRLSKERLSAIAEERKERLTSLNTEINGLKEGQRVEKERLTSLQATKEINQKQIDALEKIKSEGKELNNWQKKALADRIIQQGHLNDLIEDQSITYGEITNKIKSLKVDQESLSKEAVKFVNAANKADASTSNFATVGKKFSAYVRSSANLLSAKIIDAGAKLKHNAETAKKALIAAAKEKWTGLGKGIKQGATNVAVKGGKMMGGALLKIGTMLLSALLATKAIKPLLDTLKKVFMKVVDTVANSLGPILEMVIEAIMPLVDALIAVIGPMLKPLMPLLTILIKDVMMPLVRVLMPPLMQMLGWILKGTSLLVGALGDVASVFGNKGEAIGLGLKEMSKALGESSEAFMNFKMEDEKSMAEVNADLAASEATEITPQAAGGSNAAQFTYSEDGRALSVAAGSADRNKAEEIAKEQNRLLTEQNRLLAEQNSKLGRLENLSEENNVIANKKEEARKEEAFKASSSAGKPVPIL